MLRPLNAGESGAAMPCSGDGSTGVRTEQWRFENWARTQRVLVPVLFNPEAEKVHQIVAAVREVERVQGTLKAIGSGWAYGGVAVDESTQHVIYTERLNHLLRGSDATDKSHVVPYALLEGLQARAKYFVHVEAGIKVHELNCELDKLGLAMPTLGGSNGQSLAGAISTGTHGADVSAPPIADAVAAIHLVGPGGQEWWIERDEDDGAITDPDRMSELRQRGVLCGDIRIEYDTSLFRAVLVSMGRMGVIYSYVLEAVDAFGLTTTREQKPWTEVRSWLRDPGHAVWDNRWLEIFVNPYPDSAGEHNCVVTTKALGTPPFTPDPPVSSDVFDSFCRSAEIPQILTSSCWAYLLAIATAEATAAPLFAALLAVPIAGPFLHVAAHAAIVGPFTVLAQEVTAAAGHGPGRELRPAARQCPQPARDHPGHRALPRRQGGHPRGRGKPRVVAPAAE